MIFCCYFNHVRGCQPIRCYHSPGTRIVGLLRSSQLYDATTIHSVISLWISLVSSSLSPKVDRSSSKHCILISEVFFITPFRFVKAYWLTCLEMEMNVLRISLRPVFLNKGQDRRRSRQRLSLTVREPRMAICSMNQVIPTKGEGGLKDGSRLVVLSQITFHH